MDTFTATLLDSAVGFAAGTLVQVHRGTSRCVQAAGFKLTTGPRGGVRKVPLPARHVMDVAFPDGVVRSMDATMFVRGDHSAAAR